jgi:hypothetical protein
MLRARLKAAKRAHRERVFLAWQTAAFIGLSKPTPWDKILDQIDPPPPQAPQTSDEIMRRMGLWAAVMSREAH